MKRSPKVRKSESPEDSLKSDPDSYQDESPKSEERNVESEKEKNSEIDSHQSALNKSEIEHPKSEIEMEVHHHPEVEKKGLKEYILEGLMIFLAVMMGFFAESIRENTTNGEHVKQLTMQLVDDLKNDTASLQENIVYERMLP